MVVLTEPCVPGSGLADTTNSTSPYASSSAAAEPHVLTAARPSSAAGSVTIAGPDVVVLSPGPPPSKTPRKYKTWHAGPQKSRPVQFIIAVGQVREAAVNKFTGLLR